MKRILLVVAVVFATVTYAQTGKGNWMVGADLGLSFQSKNVVEKDDQVQYMDQTITTFKITPNFNYFVVHNLAVGLGLEYQSTTTKVKPVAGSETKGTTSAFVIAPNAHYYFPIGGNLAPFVGAKVGYAWASAGDNNSDKERGLALGVKGGMAYFVNQGAALTGYVGYDYMNLKNKQDNKAETRIGNFGVGIGVALFF